MSPPTKRSWCLLLSPETQALLLLHSRLGLDQVHARHLVGCYKRNHPGSLWVAGIASSIVCLGWMFAFGRTIDAFDPTFDEFRHRHPWIALPMLLLAGYGAAIALATLVYVRLQTRLILRPIRRCVELPACFQCDQSLEGVPRTDGRLTCPECGVPWPLVPPPCER